MNQPTNQANQGSKHVMHRRRIQT